MEGLAPFDINAEDSALQGDPQSELLKARGGMITTKHLGRDVANMLVIQKRNKNNSMLFWRFKNYSGTW